MTLELHAAIKWLTNEEQQHGKESNPLQLTIAELRWALFRVVQGREGRLFESKEEDGKVRLVTEAEVLATRCPVSYSCKRGAFCDLGPPRAVIAQAAVAAALDKPVTRFHSDRVNACARRLDNEDAVALLLVVCARAK